MPSLLNLIQQMKLPGILGTIVLFIAAFSSGFLCMFIKGNRKRKREEQQQAAKRLQEDALDKALANPLAENDKTFSNNKRPVKVEYVKELKEKKQFSGGMFELTETTELSQRTYIYRNGEVVSIGYQYGSVSVLPENVETTSMYCQIFFYQGDNYIRSLDRCPVVLRRKKNQTIVNRNGIKLINKDVFIVGKSSYQIKLMPKV